MFLQGIGIGNGWMSPLQQGKYAQFLFYHGLLDGEQYMHLLDLEKDLLAKVRNRTAYKVLNVRIASCFRSRAGIDVRNRH